jgi:archaellum component FlaC
MPILDSGLKEMLDDLDKLRSEISDDMGRLRSEVDAVSSNIVRITNFLAHLAGTPPSFPSDLRPE